MPNQSCSSTLRIEQLEVHLKNNRYAAAIQRRYLWLAQRFVDYLKRKSLAIEASICRRQRWRSFCDGSFEVGVAGTDGIRVISSNGVGATKMPSTCFCGWCTDSGPP